MPTGRSQDARNYSAPAIGRAFVVIEHLAEHQKARYSELVERLGIAKSSTHVILANLEILGYIYRDSNSYYRLTSKFSNLSNHTKNTAQLHDLVVSSAKSHLIELRNSTGLAVHLATLDGSNVYYLDKIEAEDFIKFDTYVGKRAPLHLTAVGRAILASLTSQKLEELLPSLNYSAGNDNSPKDAKDVMKQIQAFRVTGYATEKEEEAIGVECLAVAIPLKKNTYPYSVGVVGMTYQMKEKDINRVAKLVTKAAKQIAKEVGDF